MRVHLWSVAYAALMVFVGTAHSVLAAEREDIANAEQAAASWLALIDVGAYDEGWQRATGDIRKRAGVYEEGGDIRQSEQFNWTEWMRERRGQLGNLLSRTIVYAGPLRFPRGEPQGKFLEIEYDTDFYSISDLFEYVMLERGKNDSWTVCWYFVRKKPSSELSQVDDSPE
jgi:hypothetical protein